jgi:hypothetical protein
MHSDPALSGRIWACGGTIDPTLPPEARILPDPSYWCVLVGLVGPVRTRRVRWMHGRSRRPCRTGDGHRDDSAAALIHPVRDHSAPCSGRVCGWYPLVSHSPHSSGERATASGAVSAGSNPAGGAYHEQAIPGLSCANDLAPVELLCSRMPPEAAKCRESRNIRGMRSGPSSQLSPRNDNGLADRCRLRASQGTPPSACTTAHPPRRCSARRRGKGPRRCARPTRPPAGPEYPH